MEDIQKNSDELQNFLLTHRSQVYNLDLWGVGGYIIAAASGSGKNVLFNKIISDTFDKSNYPLLRVFSNTAKDSNVFAEHPHLQYPATDAALRLQMKARKKSDEKNFEVWVVDDSLGGIKSTSKTSPIAQLFTRARNDNLVVFFIIQDPFLASRTLRENARYVILMKTNATVTQRILTDCNIHTSNSKKVAELLALYASNAHHYILLARLPIPCLAKLPSQIYLGTPVKYTINN